MLKQLRTDESGLTLIELTIVIVILGILAAFIAPRIADAPQKANVSKAKVEIESLSTALQLYAAEVGNYPTTEQGLDALWRVPNPAPPNWQGPYLRKQPTNDPWGNPYVYRNPGTQYGYDFDLLSYGRDGKLGGVDFDKDIANWVEETTAQ
jgi:general secretion pathway protein G